MYLRLVSRAKKAAMPDRYGDNPEHESQLSTGPGGLRPAGPYAIAHCELCDDDGLRGGFRCDHVDYGAIAKRGIDAVRAALREARR